MSASEEREQNAEERRLARHARTVIMNTLKSGGVSNAGIANILCINENDVRDILGPDPDVNWGHNCLTQGVHHGRPESIWNLPLLQAVQMFGSEELKELVVARIYNDAMQYVKHADTDHHFTTLEWANQVKELAEKRYFHMLTLKVDEISRYYKSTIWKREQVRVIDLIKKDKLNPTYKPRHSHDSINMLCRIIGVNCSSTASAYDMIYTEIPN